MRLRNVRGGGGGSKNAHLPHLNTALIRLVNKVVVSARLIFYVKLLSCNQERERGCLTSRNTLCIQRIASWLSLAKCKIEMQLIN